MVYTPDMLEKIKGKRNLIYIILGFLLIIAGLSGNLFVFFDGNKPITTGAFRYVERIAAEEPVVLEPTEEKVETPILEDIFKKSGLDSNSYFIHPSLNKTLEVPLIPDKIEIPAIKLIAPIKIADFNFTDLEGETFGQWIPKSEFSAAWHPNSALIGQKGNTVINGHHNEFGEVFGKLIDLESGDLIYVYAKGKKYAYVISNKMILLERGQPLEIRMANAEWLGGTDDERLTLVTCWPEKSNTHRLIIVARPYQ